MRRLVGGTPKGAEHRRSCRVEGLSRFMPGNQWALLLASERDLERRGNPCVRELWLCEVEDGGAATKKEHCPWLAVASGCRTQVRNTVSSLTTRFSLRAG